MSNFSMSGNQDKIYEMFVNKILHILIWHVNVTTWMFIYDYQSCISLHLKQTVHDFEVQVLYQQFVEQIQNFINVTCVIINAKFKSSKSFNVDSTRYGGRLLAVFVVIIMA